MPIHRAIVMGTSKLIEPCDLPEAIFANAERRVTYNEALKASRRDIVSRALVQTDGDYKQAAALLDLFPTSLLRLIRNLGLKG